MEPEQTKVSDFLLASLRLETNLDFFELPATPIQIKSKKKKSPGKSIACHFTNAYHDFNLTGKEFSMILCSHAIDYKRCCYGSNRCGG